MSHSFVNTTSGCNKVTFKPWGDQIIHSHLAILCTTKCKPQLFIIKIQHFFLHFQHRCNHSSHLFPTLPFISCQSYISLLEFQPLGSFPPTVPDHPHITVINQCIDPADAYYDSKYKKSTFTTSPHGQRKHSLNCQMAFH